jgi:hypothetical protein
VEFDAVLEVKHCSRATRQNRSRHRGPHAGSDILTETRVRFPTEHRCSELLVLVHLCDGVLLLPGGSESGGLCLSVLEGGLVVGLDSGREITPSISQDRRRADGRGLRAAGGLAFLDRRQSRDLLTDGLDGLDDGLCGRHLDSGDGDVWRDVVWYWFRSIVMVKLLLVWMCDGFEIIEIQKFRSQNTP